MTMNLHDAVRAGDFCAILAAIVVQADETERDGNSVNSVNRLTRRCVEKRRGEFGLTPLHVAACYGQAYEAGLLVSLGADTETTDTHGGGTPLHWAADHGHVEVLQALVEQNADKEAKDRLGRTPLHWAAFNGQAETAKLLVQLGADQAANDDDGATPMQTAASRGHGEVATVLAESSVCPELVASVARAQQEASQHQLGQQRRAAVEVEEAA